MKQSIQTPPKEIKKYFSSSTIARSVTAHILQDNISELIWQLDEYDIAYLCAVENYSAMKHGYCHEHTIKIGARLKSFGASKGVARTKSYAMASHVHKLGLTERSRRHTRATYETVLTSLGKAVLNHMKTKWFNSDSVDFSQFRPIEQSQKTNDYDAVTLPDLNYYDSNIIIKDRVGSVDIFSCYRCKITGLIRFHDDTIQNLADDYGLEAVRNAISRIRKYKRNPNSTFSPIGYLVVVLRNHYGDCAQMKEKTQSVYHNALSAQELRDKAITRARDELKSLGITYPVRTPGMSAIDFYDATLAYGQKETQLISRYLKPSPRPLAFDNVMPMKEWGRPYCD